MITVHKNFTRNKLTEIMQQKRTRYAHAVENPDGTITQVHQECLCRDFLGDVVLANIQNAGYSIYGMSYDPNKDPRIDLERTGLLIYFPNTKDEECFKDNFKFLQMLEESYGINKSIYKNVDEKLKFVIGNRWWMDEAYRFSFYTFVLRCLAYKVTAETPEEVFKYISKEYQTNEKNYITRHEKSFYKFVKNLPLIKRYHYTLYSKPGIELRVDSNTWENGIDQIHNYTGFFTYLQYEAKGKV